MKRQRVKGPSVASYRGRRRGGGRVRLIVAAVCAAAGVALAVVRLWGMRFSGYLLLAAAAALAASVLLDRLAADSGGGWEILRRLFYGGAALGLTVLLCIEGFIVRRGNADRTALPVDAVIVLGAGVNGKEPSLSLRTRLDAALDYLTHKNTDAPVVLTGGMGYGEEITEARCMYDWLAARGVPADRLILEERAASTVENFEFSKGLLEARGVDVEGGTVAIVTNDFHIARAELVAERQGYGGAIGVPAKLPWRHLAANYYLREAFAVVKTVLFP